MRASTETALPSLTCVYVVRVRVTPAALYDACIREEQSQRPIGSLPWESVQRAAPLVRGAELAERPPDRRLHLRRRVGGNLVAVRHRARPGWCRSPSRRRPPNNRPRNRRGAAGVGRAGRRRARRCAAGLLQQGLDGLLQGGGQRLPLGVRLREARLLHRLGGLGDGQGLPAGDLLQPLVELRRGVHRVEDLAAPCPSPATAAAGTDPANRGRRRSGSAGRSPAERSPGRRSARGRGRSSRRRWPGSSWRWAPARQGRPAPARRPSPCRRRSGWPSPAWRRPRCPQPVHRRSSRRPKRSRHRCQRTAGQQQRSGGAQTDDGSRASSSRPPPFSATAVRTRRRSWVGARACQGMLHRSGSSCS